MNKDKLSDEEMEIAMKGLHDVWNSADGLALQSPTPEQIDHEILEQLSLFRQKIADLETAKEFNSHIHDNITKRLNEAEDKLRIMERIVSGIELSRLRGNG